MLKTLFPQAYKAKDLGALIVALIVYIVIDFVCGLIIGLLSALPLIGFLFSIIGWAIGVYAFVGIILSLLVFFKIVK